MHEGAGYRMKLELGVMLPAILSALAVMAYLGFSGERVDGWGILAAGSGALVGVVINLKLKAGKS